ncbi:MAG: phenylalanine--tRNA ligase beta subunit-related protein [Thermoanaerobaculum sp.]|nr:phenylalanine--tRNA ligase beta subunit-related protein [Thermoanaerobaculum sp.]
MVFPPKVRFELPGWSLYWARLAATGLAAGELARLRQEVAQRLRASVSLEDLAQHPTAAAVRRLFRQAGCDPTRWRPSSEALARRLLKGEAIPAISPLVDLNNCLSVELLVPACVLREGSVRGTLNLRAGRHGEVLNSLRGTMPLEGKPLLTDEEGPFSTPISDAQRVKVHEDTDRVWLVAYLPQGVVSQECVRQALKSLLNQAPVAKVEGEEYLVGFYPE